MGLPGSPLGFHSWDAGISESLVFWTTPLPPGSAKVDLARGTASLKAKNVCSVFDAFTVANSLSSDRSLGFASGIINSLDIEWSGVTKSFPGIHDSANRFMGNFFQIGSVTIAVTATTPVSTGQGFRFVSDPASTIVNFAQIGSESNGVFFS
ncbi:MAG: hypothetical protein DMG40_19985 [Acidobacteria bacterium]|nr:MAG: hypothetical protein DMG40_19985 [Acidobacteriota bacterium]